MVPAPSRGRAAACSGPAPAGPRSSTGCATSWPSGSPEAGTPPRLDLVEAAQLYQTLYWIARTAAVADAGGRRAARHGRRLVGIPALVHKALHGTPLVLTEHGVYLREAYLAAARGGGSPGARFTATRLARGLARAAYAGADVICPVTDANAYWEMSLGIDPAKILVLYNGLRQPEPPAPPPGAAPGRVGRADRPAQGHPHAAAGGPRDGADGAARALPALRRGRPRAKRPTSGPASRCTSGSGSARAFASWAAPRTRTGPCAAPTSC